MRGFMPYLAKRIAWAIPTLFLVALVVFVMMRLVPGDPALVVLGDSATPEQLAALRAQYGLDKPVPVQFLYWLGQMAQGNFGHAISDGQPVLSLILERFQVTAVIVLTAVGLATLIAVPLGIIAAWRQNGLFDLVIVAGATLLLSVPSFWLGMMLLLVFGVSLGWVPVVGYVPFTDNPWQALHFVLLPIATLTLIEVGVLTRMARASAVEILRLEYITHARAKGLDETRVLLRHVLPNAFAPTWTMIGLVLGHLLGGAAVLETVFTLPGLGRLMVDAIFARDYPVVQGCLLFAALIYVFVNLVIDLCYPLFDPRVSAT